MKNVKITAVLVTLIMAVGCSANSAFTAPKEVVPPDATFTKTIGCLSLGADAYKTSPAEWTFALNARNDCGKFIYVTGDGKPAHSFIVSSSSDEVVWTWPDLVVDIIDAIPLEIDEVITFEQTWNGRSSAEEDVERGTYTLRTIFDGGPEMIDETITIEQTFDY